MGAHPQRTNWQQNCCVNYSFRVLTRVAGTLVTAATPYRASKTAGVTGASDRKLNDREDGLRRWRYLNQDLLVMVPITGGQA
jgi:hypothetical protein